jgi:CBS domain-containing protein
MPVEPESIERHLASDLRTLAYSLRSLVRRAPVTCGAQEPVGAVVARMQREGVGSIVVVDAQERPVGIFTERDLLHRALATDLARPIEAVMTDDPLTLAASTPAYEAALAMIERGIRHVLVTDGAALVGVVAERDLFSLQRLGLGELTLEIRRAATIDALAAAAARVQRLTRLLIMQGMAAEHLTLYVSLLNDRICQRVIGVLRTNYTWGRFSWCWLALGSEGRFEQTFATDQDNGLLFQPHDGATADEVRAQLLPFARAVNEALAQCGFPLCKGNVMASNPALCGSVAEWKAKLQGWLDVSDPQALLDAAICFDFRPLFGDAELAQELRDSLLAATRVRQNFLRLLAEAALKSRPPHGNWLDYITGDGAGARGPVDLKRDGARIFVDCARIFSLAHALPATGTADRLRAAAERGIYPAPEAEAAVSAFFLIQQLRLRHQAGLAAIDENNANRIDLEELNPLERRTLKEAFRVARELQARIALDYNL